MRAGEVGVEIELSRPRIGGEMKAIRILSAILLIALFGIPLRALAQNAPEVFALPDGIAGGPYQANIQTVLREKYQLKLETDVSASVFRWSFAGGEMPPGLVVRPTGTIVGTPRVSRDEPYRFQVKVVDLAYAGSEALRLDLILTIGAHRIRLTKVRTPRLTPVNAAPAATDQKTSQVLETHGAERVGTHAERVADVHSAFLETATSPTASYVGARSEVEPPAPLNRPAGSSNSGPPITDSSYDPDLIRPVLHSLPVKPPDSISDLLSSDKELEIDVAKERASGDKIRGPAEIKLKNLNVLRYDIRVGRDVTFPAAPDLTLPFIPPIPSQPQRNISNAFIFSRHSGDPIPDAFSNLAEEFNDIEDDKARYVNGDIVEAINTLNRVVNTLEALVAGSDSTLTTGGGPSAIIAEITALIDPVGGATPEIDLALTQTWPDAEIEELLGRLEILRNGLLTLRTIPDAGQTTWIAWYTANQATYEGIIARVSELQTQLNGLKSNSTQGRAFQDAQNKLRRWKPILVGVRNGGVAGFDRDFEVGCGFAFDTGKETKVKLIKRDRLADPGGATTEEEIVTVVCSSPLSVSAGFGFSNIDEREFVLVPSTKTVTANGQTTQTVISRFGFKNKSAFRTLPVLLLNTRVWEPNDTFALHLSTGAAVDVKTGQGGTDLEYIVGPSFSFWRSLFITPGLHIGRVNKLAGGFELDQEVPTGISEPPIEKTWKKGFVTTFTYKIK